VRVERKAAGEIAAGVRVGRLEISTADRIVFLLHCTVNSLPVVWRPLGRVRQR
jgi:hypothetical protein